MSELEDLAKKWMSDYGKQPAEEDIPSLVRLMETARMAPNIRAGVLERLLKDNHAYIKKLEDALEKVETGLSGLLIVENSDFEWRHDVTVYRNIAREALQSKPQSSTSKQEQ